MTTLELIARGLLITLGSFVGTLGFAIFMHAPRKAWFPASLIGGVSYGLYWTLLQLNVYEPLSIFIGALLGSLLAQYCARRMRMIATIFLLLAMIPLVPGMGLYRCMAFLAQEAYREGVDAGVRAMVDIVLIAFGLGMGSYIFRLMAMGRRKEQGGAMK